MERLHAETASYWSDRALYQSTCIHLRMILTGQQIAHSVLGGNYTKAYIYWRVVESLDLLPRRQEAC